MSCPCEAADLLPELGRETVYVGLSAGSMVMTPNIGEDFVRWKPPTGGDRTLGMVDFSLFPHLDHEDLPENTMADAERWAAGMPVRRRGPIIDGLAYASADQCQLHQQNSVMKTTAQVRAIHSPLFGNLRLPTESTPTLQQK